MFVDDITRHHRVDKEHYRDVAQHPELEESMCGILRESLNLLSHHLSAQETGNHPDAAQEVDQKKGTGKKVLKLSVRKNVSDGLDV
jgi:negative regulator of replication initiation